MANRMFKICSGEMVIANIISETDTEVVVESAMEVIFRPTPNGQLGINLFPLNPFASKLKEQITFNKVYHILFSCAEIDLAIEQQYIELTTGIKVAKPGNNGGLILPK